MKIGPIDISQRVLLIAEIGNNHEGDVRVAEEMIRQAARAEADAVKFQTFRTELYVSPKQAERVERMKKFELTPDEFRRLSDVAGENGVLFLSTPFDLPSAEMLEPLVAAYKIASGDNTFYPLIDAVARTDKPLLISGGLVYAEHLLGLHERIAAAREPRNRPPDVAILHCVSSYPVPPEEANIAAVREMGRRLPCPVGYSDHTLGNDAAVLAVAAGARIVEKHFTLDKNFSTFRDHQLSATPAELADLVRHVREAEAMLGTGVKQAQPSEVANREAIRRSICAAADLPAGHMLGREDLVWLRPGGGMEPGREAELLGRELKQAVSRGHPLRPDLCTEAKP
jgi:sialic acid synthase SpsE